MSWRHRQIKSRRPMCRGRGYCVTFPRAFPPPALATVCPPSQSLSGSQIVFFWRRPQAYKPRPVFRRGFDRLPPLRRLRHLRHCVSRRADDRRPRAGQGVVVQAGTSRAKDRVCELFGGHCSTFAVLRTAMRMNAARVSPKPAAADCTCCFCAGVNRVWTVSVISSILRPVFIAY
jgi:hypothetical protein